MHIILDLKTKIALHENHLMSLITSYLSSLEKRTKIVPYLYLKTQNESFNV